jgi:hypothetical protein
MTNTLTQGRERLLRRIGCLAVWEEIKKQAIIKANEASKNYAKDVDTVRGSVVMLSGRVVTLNNVAGEINHEALFARIVPSNRNK